MTAVQWSWYLITISLVIAYASHAVDRDITTCVRTQPIGTSPQIPDKTVWWKVDLGGVYNIYSVNILFKNYVDEERRQRGRFAGFSLYVSNDGQKESLCYKDGPLLPPLNITIICTAAGRYVRFHNERLPGVTYPSGYELTVYTELCEVIVYGCYKDGVFGNNCNTPCSGNCKTNTCQIQDGSCFRCKPGWTGATCNTECGYGFYGVDCSQQCSGHCKNNVTCDHLTGVCNDGCAAGWNGSFCDKACGVGWYGPDCKLQCFGHCKDNTSCNHLSGSCDGCAAGWAGSFCDKACAIGWYGPDCKHQCSGHCRDSTVCNQVTGSCDAGCAAGWHGLYCDKACIQSFGENCQYPCSTNCINKTCDRFTGDCLCVCEEGSNGGDLEKHSTFWSYAGPISVGINVVLTIGAFIVVWAVYSERLFVSFKQQSSARSDLYTETEVTPEDSSHYQELGVSKGETPYQNTSLNH
uniref:Multiple epidermal growth factor-like domains protein 6 isoform X2 n=1 Tax=Crassostrea virginica TaxID=6565 RepID=A0A8B8BLD4_CRAVI|nr:multiple epidermal growth factor-like domains protein 6 isoform X2 [Crassostrea virginica]